MTQRRQVTDTHTHTPRSNPESRMTQIAPVPKFKQVIFLAEFHEAGEIHVHALRAQGIPPHDRRTQPVRRQHIASGE